MKQAFEYFIEAVMVTIIIAIIVGAMNITSQIREANEFHNLAIAEVEASDFDDSIIKKYATGEVNPNVITEFKNASVTTDSSVDYASERIYKVTTTYKISLPILGYVKKPRQYQAMLDKNKITVLSTAIICIFFFTACTQTANYNKTDDTSSLLPVGSVVKVNDLGNMLIISIGEIDSNNQLYDYKGCSYPEGCTGNTYLFNRDDIISIKHKGYNSKEEVNYIKNIEKKMEELK